MLGASALAGAEITSAALGDRYADIVFSNQTYVVVQAKNGTAGAVDVTLVATSGATTVLSNGFTYTAIGQIDTVTPNNGQIGTNVVLAGQRMLGGGTEARSVTLVGEVAFVSSSSETQIDLIAVSRAAGTGDVVVTSNDRARKLYGALGGEPAGFENKPLLGHDVPHERIRWADLTLLSAVASDQT